MIRADPQLEYVDTVSTAAAGVNGRATTARSVRSEKAEKPVAALVEGTSTIGADLKSEEPQPETANATRDDAR